MKTRSFNLLAAIFAVLMSVSLAKAQWLEVGEFLWNIYEKNKEEKKKMEEIQPVYEDWLKSLGNYISKTYEVGDCNAIGFKYFSNNRGETPNFSYTCGVRDSGNIAFLYAKNKIKIGDCDKGYEFKAEFDIRKNYLDVFSFKDACVFFQPSCRSLIRNACVSNTVFSNMVFVGGGTFTTGSSKVTVNNFCIGKHEVTQKEWREVMGNNPSKFQNCGDDCPVEQVSWNDAQEFIRKLNTKTGMNYRLPTEAEWEYAARGGCRSKGYKYSGGKDLGNVAWYGNNSNKQSHPVGKKQPNEFGIYDMSGNVWEWVNSGSTIIARGGAWSSTEDRCQVTGGRASEPPNTRKDISGFRLVHSPVFESGEAQLKRMRALQTTGKTEPSGRTGGFNKEDVDKVLKNVAGLQSTGKTELGGRRGSAGGFNDGYAEGGSGGIGDMLGGLMGGDTGSIGTRPKGGQVKLSNRDIDMGSGDAARSKAEIMSILNARMPGLRNIYNKYLKLKPSFSGKVTIKFTIAPHGDIVSISILSSTTGYAEFDDAVKNMVATWKWKAIKSGNTTATISYDFTE